MTGSGIAGRSALVTGASRGIGLAIARVLVEAGVRVAMVARTESTLDAAAEATRGFPMVADIGSEEDVRRLADRFAAFAGGPPDILVNAAGAFSLAPIVSTRPEDFERQLRVNVFGPFLLVRAILPGMLARGTGHIVNVGSVAGRVGLPGNAGYGASKFGLRGFHEVLAAEIRDTGVRATLVEPAATDTEAWDEIDPDSRPDLPSRSQMLTSGEVARAVLFVLELPAGVEIPDLSIRASGNRG